MRPFRGFTLMAAAGLAVFLCSPGAAKQRKRAVSPKKQAAAPKAEQSQAASQPAPTAAPSADRDILTSAGFILEETPGGLRILRTLPQSAADEMAETGTAFYRTSDGGLTSKARLVSSGLRQGDVLLYLNGRPTEMIASAARALRQWQPGTRLSAIVSRSGSIIGFSTRLPAPEIGEKRDASLLTRREAALQETLLEEAGDPSRRPPLRASAFRIGANERLWVRFPKGILKTVREDDILEGEVSTPVSGDSSLDFIAIPQGSRVWAQVLAAREDDSVYFVKLHIYKLQPVGGHIYPVSVILTDTSGDRSLLRVSAGGTIVAAPSDDDPAVAKGDRHFQAKLLKPVTLYEPDSFYRAGPGLWFKTVREGKAFAFEVTHVIPDRAADKAGIRKGDRITLVAGRSAANVGFSEGIGLLYGAPGTPVEVQVQYSEGKGRERVQLVRGVRYATGWGLTASVTDGAVFVSAVQAGSPSDKAGLKEGVKLLRVDEQDLAALSGQGLSSLLESGLSGKKTLTVQTAGGKPQRVNLSDASFPIPIPAPTKLEVVALGTGKG
ncbi:MAG: hypothetical protein WC728_06650 [Elusimicrobiota bacterium]